MPRILRLVPRRSTLRGHSIFNDLARAVIVALVGFEVCHVLHARLDSLRHELRLLFCGLQGGEELAQAFAVPVVGDGEADPAA